LDPGVQNNHTSSSTSHLLERASEFQLKASDTRLGQPLARTQNSNLFRATAANFNHSKNKSIAIRDELRSKRDPADPLKIRFKAGVYQMKEGGQKMIPVRFCYQTFTETKTEHQ
jgi:hypothetical protein